MKTSIAPLDLVWLLTDTKHSPTHVGAMLLFEKPKGRTGLVAEIVEAYRRRAPTPPFNYVPVFKSGRTPYFTGVTTYDPTYHVGHIELPRGASYEDLLRLVADLHEPALDHDRPLFRCWLIDGVPGRRFALYIKVQHAIIDGVSGARRMQQSLSSNAKRRTPPPFFVSEAPAPARKPERPPTVVSQLLSSFAFDIVSQAQAVRDLSFGSIGKAVSRLLGRDPGGSQPFVAHRAPMNEPLRMARSFATLTLPLEEMRLVSKYFGATLNDLAVTIVDAGLHRYLRDTGREFPHRLVAMCPVSLRSEGDTKQGTQASAMFVHLGEPDSNPTERLRQVIESTSKGKSDLRGLSGDAALMYAIAVLGIAEAARTIGVDRFTPPLANLVISNVPGGQATRYLNGARLVGNYPVSAITASIGLNVTLTSYCDAMNFGLVGNGATMYDLPSLARHIERAYAELRVTARRHSSKGTKPRQAPDTRPPSHRR